MRISDWSSDVCSSDLPALSALSSSSVATMMPPTTAAVASSPTPTAAPLLSALLFFLSAAALRTPGTGASDDRAVGSAVLDRGRSAAHAAVAVRRPALADTQEASSSAKTGRPTPQDAQRTE